MQSICLQNAKIVFCIPCKWVCLHCMRSVEHLVMQFAVYTCTLMFLIESYVCCSNHYCLRLRHHHHWTNLKDTPFLVSTPSQIFILQILAQSSSTSHVDCHTTSCILHTSDFSDTIKSTFESTIRLRPLMALIRCNWRQSNQLNPYQ